MVDGRLRSLKRRTTKDPLTREHAHKSTNFSIVNSICEEKREFQN